MVRGSEVYMCGIFRRFCKSGRGPTAAEWDHSRNWGDVVLDSQPPIWHGVEAEGPSTDVRLGFALVRYVHTRSSTGFTPDINAKIQTMLEQQRVSLKQIWSNRRYSCNCFIARTQDLTGLTFVHGQMQTSNVN
jgi:hypothetical protein